MATVFKMLAELDKCDGGYSSVHTQGLPAIGEQHNLVHCTEPWNVSDQITIDLRAESA